MLGRTAGVAPPRAPFPPSRPCQAGSRGSTVGPRGPTRPQAHLGPAEIDALSTLGDLLHGAARLDLTAAHHAPTLTEAAAAVTQHAPLGYEMVVPQCSQMNCGDTIYRSTLDPKLRMEERSVDVPALLAVVVPTLVYLNLRPGVLPGFVDTFFKAPQQRRSLPYFVLSDFKNRRKLGSGAFGEVYRAQVDTDSGEPREVILKRATEFGEAEVYMNERCMRACPGAVAQFITAFDETGKVGDPLWLVWQYEGDYTLADLLANRGFPQTAEKVLFKRELKIPRGPLRDQAVVVEILQQLLECLEALHSIGLVHRDVKPQNMILSTAERKVKLIDLGAAADLRVGINYQPDEYLLDPRFSPPQQYIMSTTTPPAPSVNGFAALLSPVLWNIGLPDRFDMYSVGLVLCQMAFRGLRTDTNLIAFRRRLEALDWDLEAWRRDVETKKLRAYDDGFALLDAGDGSGWELLTQLMQKRPEDRLSARQALEHPFLTGVRGPGKAAQALQRAGASVGGLFDDELVAEISRTGERFGGFTEASLQQQLEQLGEHKDAPLEPRVSQTLAYWRSRQAAMERQSRQRTMERALRMRRKQINESGSRNGARPTAVKVGGLLDGLFKREKKQ
ncbi:unnamed protein product [Pedinophyceae sp. YPF-701]|nr:unnamed protein product [Pedinophyceae sp. YPF-701]